MSSKLGIETGLWYPNHRAFPPAFLETYIHALEDAGVVDYIMLFDILAGWYPPPLWSDEFTTLAQELPDFNSFFDAFITAGTIAARAETLGIWIGTNGLRHGPAELLQASTTLTAVTKGRALVSVGAGEAYNTIPYGYDRSRGIARVEDHFRLYGHLWERETPFDFAGKTIRYDKASIGNVRAHRPQMWAMGAGPRLQRIAAECADGWVSLAPGGVGRPEQYAEHVRDMKVSLERNGRDPESFGFALEFLTLLHDDEDELRRAMDAPFAKFFAAMFGRVNQSAWLKESIEPVFSGEWDYALKYLPNRWTKDQVMSVVNQVPTSMVEKAVLSGSPKKVASEIQAYIDAGATIVGPLDFIPPILGMGEFDASLQRQIELCRLLKQ